MVNIKRIHSRMNELNMTKAQLIKESGLTRVTIDKILSGGKINVETLEALAKGLDVNVGFFFDDNNTSIGGTVTAQEGSAASIIGNHQIGSKQEEHDELIRLREEIKYLKVLMADKDERIKELKERIEDLKTQKK